MWMVWLFLLSTNTQWSQGYSIVIICLYTSIHLWRSYNNSYPKKAPFMQQRVSTAFDFIALISESMTVCFAGLTWWRMSQTLRILTLAVFPKYLTGGSTQTKNPSIIWLRFQLMHTLFLLEGERFPLAMGRGGFFSPGAVTVALHTRMNLKRQVNCCSLHINRAIYSACLSGSFFFLHSSVSPSLSFLPALHFSQSVENVWGIDRALWL